MFDSVLERRTVPRGKLVGAGLSIGIYTALGIALFYGVSRTRAAAEQPVEVKLFTAQAAPAPPPPPPPPPPAGGSHKAVPTQVEKKPVEKKPDTVLEPQVETKPEQAPDDKPSEPAGVPGGVTGGVPGGVVGGTVGGTIGGVIGGVVGGALGGTGSTVLPFGAGMTRPTQTAGGQPSYTAQAMAARVEGKLLVRCVITVDGAVQGCSVIKSLPMLDQTVLDTLRNSHFTPVTYQGHAVNVQYLFTFNFKLP